MKCANHLEINAAGICIHCGKSICNDCQVQLKGESYCADCLSVKTGQVKKNNHSPELAGIMSFFIPGLGQVYNGQPGKGLLIFFTAWLFIPWIIGIIGAYSFARKIKQGEIELKSKPGCVIAFVIGVAVLAMVFFFLALLAAIAIPNFLKARVMANDAYAKTAVASISSAVEAYRIANNGKFPVIEANLVESKPQYLNSYFDNKNLNGYSFQVDLFAEGYKISAAPLKCSSTGSKVYVMENGRMFSEKDCQSK